MGTEDSAVGVELVDDDDSKTCEEVRPATVKGEDPGVKHVRVGEQRVRVTTSPLSSVLVRVTVIGDRADRRDVVGEFAEAAELILSQSFRGEQKQRGCGTFRLSGEVGDRELVAPRFSRCGARRDHHRLAPKHRLDCRNLMTPQPLCKLRERGAQADRRLTETRRGRCNALEMDQFPFGPQFSNDFL